MKTIHINCDLGEGGKYDAELMPLISACNIACGGHAGTVESMHQTVMLALENNTEIGAHPSYPDKVNFGRKAVKMEEEDLKTSLIAQILSLKQITEAEGGKLTHIKPHGKLYHEVAKKENIAKIVINAITEFDDDLALFAPPRSVISKLAKDRIKVVFEAFADRNYNDDYSLVGREKSNALLIEKEQVFEHLFSMFSKGKITCENGQEIACNASTFCLHSDTPNSVEILHYLQQKFKENNIQIVNT